MKIVAIIFVSAISFLFSQVFSDYSYAEASQVAMAGSVGADVSSESGIFQNPASLAGIDKNSERSSKVLIVGYSNIFNQSYLPYQYIGLIDGDKNLGLSFRSLSATNDGFGLSSESAASFSKGFFLQKDNNSCLALGFRVNAFFWEQEKSAGLSGDGSDGLDGFKKSALGLDFGIIGGLRNKYWIGGYLTNINSPMIGLQNLPSKISISLGFKPFEQVYTNLSMERLLGRNDRQIRLGFKYNIDKFISLMCGVQSNPNRFGLGMEYNLGKIILSYSFLSHHVMNPTHNIEIKIK